MPDYISSDGKQWQTDGYWNSLSKDQKERHRALMFQLRRVFAPYESGSGVTIAQLERIVAILEEA